uniref:REJ domain-containing protein n=1 Tax=Oryza meridionalis TaxID=40149 RepID=A0A0E0BXE7_9ORYZ
MLDIFAVVLLFSRARISSSTSLAGGEILASHSRRSASTSAASASKPSRFIPLAITLYMYSSTSQPPILTAASYTLHAARALPFATSARTSRVSLYTSSSPSTNPPPRSFSSRNASTSASTAAAPSSVAGEEDTNVA